MSLTSIQALFIPCIVRPPDCAAYRPGLTRASGVERGSRLGFGRPSRPE